MKTITLPLEEYEKMVSEIENLNKGLIKTEIIYTDYCYSEHVSYKEKDKLVIDIVTKNNELFTLVEKLKTECEKLKIEKYILKLVKPKKRTLWQRIFNIEPSN